MITDGIAETIILFDGRLWKRDRSCPAILLFPGTRVVVRLSAKGRMTVREMRGQYSDHGYELALEAVLARAARQPGTAPVVSPIGGLLTVLDMKTMSAMFAAGE